METLTLLKLFTFAGDPGQNFNTDWVHFPATHVRADLVISSKLFTPLGGGNNINVQLQTTYDTDEAVNVGAAVGVGGLGRSTQNITANLGPMVRLNLNNTGPVAVQGVISVWLQPKTD